MRVLKSCFLIGAVVGLTASCSTLAKRTHEYSVKSDVFAVHITKYEAATPSNKSLVILPPTGGTNTIDKSYAKAFSGEGYDVYILNDWSHPGETGDDVERHQRAYSNSQKAIELALKDIKTPFIGMLGTSLGATYASVAANVFPELDAVFMIVGGLPLSNVIVTSDHADMRAFHVSRMKRYGFKDDREYAEAIDAYLKLEPTRLGRLHETKDIGTVVAKKDTTVPYATQKNLVEFFHPRKTIELPNAHFWAIVKTWLFHTAELVSFFNESASRKLSGPSGGKI